MRVRSFVGSGLFLSKFEREGVYVNIYAKKNKGISLDLN